MDVETWLGSLGLDQYGAVFRDRGIEADVLLNLNEQTLREIGLPLGHRLRLLRAIRGLASGAPRKATETIVVEGAERRHLTVLFFELVGLSALSQVYDPEEIADIIRAVQNAVEVTIARFDGHVARWAGNGATVYFGYPHAHEDDAERAVRSGFALQTALSTLDRPNVRLSLRVGVSSGLVVVGEVIGEGEARERGVVGDTANLAARLRSEAAPGSILVSESTRRLLGKAFELTALGEQSLKGFRSGVTIWRVTGIRDGLSRFDAIRAESTSLLVGREDAIAFLLERWRRATERRGQVVLLSGEAGIGKSRVLTAFKERLDAEQQYIVMRYQCSPHHLNDAFYPVIGQLWRAAGFVSGEPVGARLDKLSDMIAATGLAPDRVAPFLAALLAIPTAGRYQPLDLAPTELRERTLSALIAMTTGLSNQLPILIILEDAHWIDPTTLDLATRVVDALRHLPILLVISARPEFVSPWPAGHVAPLVLTRLERHDALRMIDGVAAGKQLPSQVVEQILSKTDGIPLFIEELTRSVLESGLLREEDGSYVLASALTPLAIPSTLHDSLSARLDRLSSIKETAQIGAAIGREFSHGLLEAVSPIKGAALHGILEQLEAAELIHRRGTASKASYVFKHALVQDAAYGSLLRERRQAIHAQIAQALKANLTEGDFAPATIAHHYTEAGLAASAAAAWLSAAELALSQSAPVEAERHAAAGLLLIRMIPEGHERDALELSLLVARAYALAGLRSISAPETFEVMNAAKQLLDRGIGTDLQRVSVLFGLCSEATLRARMTPALDLAHQIIGVAERQKDPTFHLVAYRMLATNQFYAGHHRLALDSLLHAKQYSDPGRQVALSHRFGWDPGLAVMSFEVLVRQALGLIDSALNVSEEVLARISSHTHAATIANATFCAVTWPKAMLADLSGLESGSASLNAYCTEKKAEQIRLLARLHHAYACAMRDPGTANSAAVQEAFDHVRLAGGSAGSSMILAHLVEVALSAGDLERAQADLQRGLAFVEKTGERFWLSELHRLDGQIALHNHIPDQSRAETCFKRAIEIARGQEGRLLELRAANDLARLWRKRQSAQDVHALLNPILATIEGGATATDVCNARQLLAESA